MALLVLPYTCADPSENQKSHFFATVQNDIRLLNNYLSNLTSKICKHNFNI